MSDATPGQAARILPAYGTVGDAELWEAVHQALGFASVCWEPMDCTGTFDSTRAAQAAGELLEIIRRYAAAREPHAAPEPVRRSLRIERYPAQDIVVTVDGQPARYVHSKFTPDVITLVYEEVPGRE